MPLTRIDSAFLDLDAIGGLDFDVQSGVPTLKVDAVNHRVGIGTDNPTKKLEVYGGDALINGLTVGRGNSSVSTNTAFGSNVLVANTTTGSFNTGVGADALAANTNGDKNTAIGRGALESNTTTHGNTALGYRALRGATDVSYSVAIGYEALLDTTTGDRNIAIGFRSMQNNLTGTKNIVIGEETINFDLDANNNTVIGYKALRGGSSTSTVNNNVVIGMEALGYSGNCTENVAIGYRAAHGDETSSVNYVTQSVAIGCLALTNAGSGIGNVAIGYSSLGSTRHGGENTAVGKGSLYANVSGYRNASVGKDSLFSNIEGDYNVAIGDKSGYYIEGNNNTILGAYEGVAGDSSLNDTVIISAGATERLRIDSSGRLLVGTSTALNVLTSTIDLVGTGASVGQPAISIANFANTASATARPQLNFYRTRGTQAAPTVNASNDLLAQINFNAYDGNSTNNYTASKIECFADAAHGVADTPGRIVFSTTADGASSPTERLRITSAGNVGIGTDNPGAKLQVTTADTTYLKLTSTTSNVDRFVVNGSGAVGIDIPEASIGARLHIGTAAASGIIVEDSIGDTVFIADDGNGRVGVGTGIPTHKLEVNGGDIRVDNGTTSDGILGLVWSTTYFGLKHADQTLNSEYMIMSANSSTFISATAGNNVYIRYGGNDSTNQLTVGSGADALTWRGSKIFHAGNDGSGSGLDADTLDGLQLGTGRNNSANQVVRTNDVGYAEFGWINTTSGQHTETVTKVYSTYTTDGYIRHCTPNHLANSITSFGDVKLAAGKHLMRSDHHSGHLEGSYNNVGANTTKSNPIYTIGSSYNPSDAALGNMYGIGYSHSGATFISLTGASGWGMYVAADGDARIYLGGSNGNISCTGTLYQSASDGRLKTNVVPITDPIEKLKKIRGVTFDWVEDIASEYDFHPHSMHEHGVIAQEIQEVIPDAVDIAPFNGNYTEKNGTDHNFLTVQRDKIVPLLIEAMKEQQTLIESLTARIEALEST